LAFAIRHLAFAIRHLAFAICHLAFLESSDSITVGSFRRNVVTVTGRLLDDDQHRDVLKYLTLTVEPAQLKTEAALLRQNCWLSGRHRLARTVANGSHYWGRTRRGGGVTLSNVRPATAP